MIINHNMNAMTAHRQMGINTGNQGKAIEKLSSGQKINRAGDDAAGLAISEKMRGQIRGLEGASTNAQDGVSLIQTAEGALNETHNILQRMRELSVQGANDTNVAEDRDAITKEMDALMEEIDRISTDTEFNGQKLLNGDFTDKKLQIGANTNQNVGLDIGNMNSDSLGLLGVEAPVTNTKANSVSGITVPTTTGMTEDIKVTVGLETTAAGEDGTGAVIEKVELDIKAGMTEDDINKLIAGNDTLKGKVTATISEAGELSFAKVSAAGASEKTVGDVTFGTNPAALGTTAITGKASTVLSEDITLKVELNGETTNVKIAAGTVATNDAITAAIKDTKGLENLSAAITDGQLTLTSSVGTDELTASKVVNPVSVADHESATKSIEVIDNAINKVSSQRADLGALQNRLEHTIATNDNSAENLQAAESRIRDVDMAKEMMNLSKNNVLVQAAQSMLGQANQQPNQVLSLLR